MIPSEEQQSLRDAFSRWYSSLSADHIMLDRQACFPAAKWDIVRSSGLLRLPFAQNRGGLGADLPTLMYVLEGLGYGCRDGGLNFSVVTHMVSTGIPIERFGNPTLQQRWLPRLCEGEVIGAHAISEPGSGSDALAMQTTAVADADTFVLNGSKSFVTNGPLAGLLVVYAKTNPSHGSLGITAFVIERDTPGLSFGEPIEKMGLRTSPLCELFFQDCRVPAANVIGQPGLGFAILDYVMKWEILCSFITIIGEMQHRLERCVDYSSERKQFRRPIGSFQLIASKLVQMKMDIETIRLWFYETARKFTEGQTVTVEVAIAKLMASEANLASALNAVQVFGGNGYMEEYGLAKDLRNAVAGTIYSGTSEIQRDRIARMMGLPPAA